MPTKKKAEIAESVDYSSNEPVVFFVGAAAGADVPGRDLTKADLAYIHRVKALRESGGDPVDRPTADDLAALAKELVATGGFSRKAPETVTEPAAGEDAAPTPSAAPAPDAGADAPTEAPAAPAEAAP